MKINSLSDCGDILCESRQKTALQINTSELHWVIHTNDYQGRLETIQSGHK